MMALETVLDTGSHEDAWLAMDTHEMVFIWPHTHYRMNYDLIPLYNNDYLMVEHCSHSDNLPQTKIFILPLYYAN
jgi:hypothetical protein